jgi:hypothetical protein
MADSTISEKSVFGRDQSAIEFRDAFKNYSPNFELFIISSVELLEVPRSQHQKQLLWFSMQDEGKSLKRLCFQLQPSTRRL